MATSSSLAQCAGYPLSILSDDPPNAIMFMPAGTQRVQPFINGEPAEEEIEIEVGLELADQLQRDLEARLQENVRPYADFDHRSGPAAFLPRNFFWKDGEGIYLAGDWTDAGRNAVKGRDYSYFSPSIMLDEDDKVIGLPPTGAIGALTNNPAFRDIRRIAASHSVDTNKKSKFMAEENQLLTDLTTRLETSNAQLTAITTRLEASSAHLATVSGRCDALEARCESLANQLATAQRAISSVPSDESIRESVNRRFVEAEAARGHGSAIKTPADPIRKSALARG